MKLFFFIFLFAPVFLFSQQKYCISNIYIKGNSITKSRVLIRELPFKQGDTIVADKLEGVLKMAKNNLLNLSLFNFVYVTTSCNPGNNSDLDIIISVEERWFIWPLIDIKLEDRNLSNWIRTSNSDRITLDAGFRVYNMWGLNHTVSASYKFGYHKGLSLSYENISLGQTGRHVIGFVVSGQFSKTENFISLFNSPVYNRSVKEFAVKKISASINYTYRPEIRISHTVLLKYENINISDTILVLNPKYWGNRDTTRNSLSFNYVFVSDQRDSYQYPLEGYLIKGEVRGYVNNTNTVRYGQLRTNLQYYLPLSDKWNVCANLSSGVSMKNVQAYIFDRAIGYEDATLRGYEFYVNDGQQFVTFNPTIKYNILPTRVTVLNFLSFLPKFRKIHFTIYGKAFFDMGYSHHSYPNYSNFLSNKFLCSGGLGLDLITYYNINLSIDYSFNQLKEHGFFFSIKSLLF